MCSRLAIALVLSAGAVASTAEGAELSPAQFAVLTHDLNDPESAKVRDVTTSTKFADVLCGEINWRNAQGGFEGYRRFWLDVKARKSAIAPLPAYSAWADAMGCATPR